MTQKKKKNSASVGTPAGGSSPAEATHEVRIADGFVPKHRMTDQVAELHDLAKALTTSLEVEVVLQTIMERVEKLMSPDTWTLLLADEEASELSFQIEKGKPPEQLKDMKLQMNQGIAGWVAMHGEGMVVPDVSADPRFEEDSEAGGAEQKMHSLVCVPVLLKDRVLGVIELLNYHGHRDFDEQDMQLLSALAEYVAIALQNAFHVKKIHELTITDDLTGLYNSRQFHESVERELNRAKRYAFQFSVLFLDLDYFKTVNDTHGHLVGSRLLTDVGKILRESLRDSDSGFRYGGDEFVLLLPHTDTVGAVQISRRILAKLAATEFLEDLGLSLKISASVGVASYPADADTKDDLIRLADEAMYHVKKTSRGDVAAASKIRRG